MARGAKSGKVILIEDDEALAREIVAALVAEALPVERLAHPTDILGGAHNGSVILFDRLRDGQDNIHVLEKLRAAGDGTPVIIISCLDSVQERINGLRSGADDYLIKPFAMGELVARVVAARRRRESQPETELRAGPLVLDRIGRRVLRDGRPVDLLPREYQLLSYLMQNAGSVLTRGMLLQNVWGLRGSTPTNVVDVHIGHLRKKVEAPAGPQLIFTVRGIGFMLKAVG